MNRPDLRRRLGLVALIAVLLAAIGFVASKSGPLATVKVTVAQVAEKQIQPSIFGIGTVEARRNWMIGPTVAARVLNVRADVGQLVKAGDVLAEMDPVDLDERIRALDASVARANSQQSVARAQLADALARRELAALNARRNQELAAQNFISAGALESRLQEKASADAAHLAALANLDGAGQDASRLVSERAALMRQRGNLKLTAPTDGLVIGRDAEAGSTVLAGQAVLRMIDPRSLWIRTRIDQGRSEKLAVGLAAQIVLRSRPGKPLAGKVARVEPVADSVTEERIVQVGFDLPSNELNAPPAVGDLAEVVLALPATGKALIVPSAAIQREKGQAGVWRLVDGSPQFTPVRTGISSPSGEVQILEGVHVGDTVIVHRQKALSPGSRLTVVGALTDAPKSAGAP